MNRDQVFERTAARAGGFRFDEEVAAVFDDMLARSVPFYLEQQSMIREIGRTFWVPGTDVYDLGCSTATTLIGLAGEIPAPARLIGYDSSAPMLERARDKVHVQGVAERIDLRLADLSGDLAPVEIANASVVTLCWTLQFIPPLRRADLLRWVYEGLVDGGALVVTEKVLANESEATRVFVDLYNDFKRRNFYSEAEIERKREALENVLIPYRPEQNEALFRDAGFELVEPFFRWYNFMGFLCIKPPHQRTRC